MGRARPSCSRPLNSLRGLPWWQASGRSRRSHHDLACPARRSVRVRGRKGHDWKRFRSDHGAIDHVGLSGQGVGEGRRRGGHEAVSPVDRQRSYCGGRRRKRASGHELILRAVLDRGLGEGDGLKVSTAPASAGNGEGCGDQEYENGSPGHGISLIGLHYRTCSQDRLVERCD
jgi:hypothetical protein